MSQGLNPYESPRTAHERVCRPVTAIQWNEGEYRLAGQVSAELDVEALAKDGILRDVTEPNGAYSDHVGVLSRNELVQYGKNSADKESLKAFLGNDPRANFFLVHQFEWESGLGD